MPTLRTLAAVPVALAATLSAVLAAPVNAPAAAEPAHPAGRVDSLAGQRWWAPVMYELSRGMATLTFLDDQWAFISDGFEYDYLDDGDDVPASCTEENPVAGEGCHPYSYDSDTGQLQVGEVSGYTLPVRVESQDYYGDMVTTWVKRTFSPSRVVGRVRTDARYDFRGYDPEFRLRKDGTFRIDPAGGRGVIKGRYRFLGTTQKLWLNPAHRGLRNAFATPVELYFQLVDGKRRLKGVRTYRFGTSTVVRELR